MFNHDNEPAICNNSGEGESNELNTAGNNWGEDDMRCEAETETI